MDARQYAALPDPFPMWRGGTLHGARIAYETWGTLNAARDNALLLFTGLSPPAHAASSAQDPAPGWWEGMVGPKLAIDSERFFVICVNSLGSCFGSTGPASIDPATERPYRLSFPDLSIEDIARAGFETARSLGVTRLDTVMGPSLGGMVVLAYAALFPRSRAAPGVYLRHRGGGRLCDRTALHPARGHHLRSRPGRLAPTPPSVRR